MRATDAAVRTALEAAGLTVHMGEVPVDADGQTVLSTLPYVAVRSNIGDNADLRMCGGHGLVVTEYAVTYVGAGDQQAKWAGEKARTAMAKIAGRRTVLEQSVRVREDQDARVQSGGEFVNPWFGVDIYSVPSAVQ